jgi:hypothetical protein
VPSERGGVDRSFSEYIPGILQILATCVGGLLLLGAEYVWTDLLHHDLPKGLENPLTNALGAIVLAAIAYSLSIVRSRRSRSEALSAKSAREASLRRRNLVVVGSTVLFVISGYTSPPSAWRRNTIQTPPPITPPAALREDKRGSIPKTPAGKSGQFGAPPRVGWAGKPRPPIGDKAASEGTVPSGRVVSKEPANDDASMNDPSPQKVGPSEFRQHEAAPTTTPVPDLPQVPLQVPFSRPDQRPAPDPQTSACEDGCSSRIGEFKFVVEYPNSQKLRDRTCNEKVFELPSDWPGGPFLHSIICKDPNSQMQDIVHFQLAKTDQEHDQEWIIVFDGSTGRGFIETSQPLSYGRRRLLRKQWRVDIFGGGDIESMIMKVTPFER